MMVVVSVMQVDSVWLDSEGSQVPVGPPARPGSKAQVASTGQAVRIMVWLGLESWSYTYNTLFPQSHQRLSILMLG